MDTMPGTRSGGDATMTAAGGVADAAADTGGASRMRGVCWPVGVTAGTVTSFWAGTGRTGTAAPRGLVGARSASRRFSYSLSARYCSHIALRSSAGTLLTSAKLRRAWARCWLLRAAHSIMRLCRVVRSSADMFA